MAQTKTKPASSGLPWNHTIRNGPKMESLLSLVDYVFETSFQNGYLYQVSSNRCSAPIALVSFIDRDLLMWLIFIPLYSGMLGIVNALLW